MDSTPPQAAPWCRPVPLRGQQLALERARRSYQSRSEVPKDLISIEQRGNGLNEWSAVLYARHRRHSATPWQGYGAELNREAPAKSGYTDLPKAVSVARSQSILQRDQGARHRVRRSAD